MNIENLEFKKHVKIVYEICEAAEIEEDITIQTHPEFKSSTKLFPKGSYVVKYKDGNVELFEKIRFNKYFHKPQEQ